MKSTYYGVPQYVVSSSFPSHLPLRSKYSPISLFSDNLNSAPTLTQDIRKQQEDYTLVYFNIYVSRKQMERQNAYYSGPSFILLQLILGFYFEKHKHSIPFIFLRSTSSRLILF